MAAERAGQSLGCRSCVPRFALPVLCTEVWAASFVYRGLGCSIGAATACGPPARLCRAATLRERERVCVCGCGAVTLRAGRTCGPPAPCWAPCVLGGSGRWLESVVGIGSVPGPSRRESLNCLSLIGQAINSNQLFTILRRESGKFELPVCCRLPDTHGQPA